VSQFAGLCIIGYRITLYLNQNVLIVIINRVQRALEVVTITNKLTNQPTNYMELSTTHEATSFMGPEGSLPYS
jgi:hypothetical protein